MTEWAVTLSVILNLLTYELIGVAAGGMITPGYLALFWDQPGRIAATLLMATAARWLVARGLGRVVLLYGRRRYAAMLVTGMALTWLGSLLAPHFGPAGDVRAIGFIVTGLIANEMELQGVVPTVLVTLGLTAVVRVAVVLLAGGMPG